jgi:hypothetical protein
LRQSTLRLLKFLLRVATVNSLKKKQSRAY